ncbi:MAG: response regulator [Bacteroidetes bacterium]|nr:response regulator [Bacteroidota bacterium]
MQVLIVDGSVQIIERMQQELADMEHITTVFGAVAYRDGVEFFRAVKPPVVLLDSRLKDNECIRLMQVIRNEVPHTRIIVMLNGEDNHIQEKYRLAGANLLFDKYHEFQKIPSAVNSIGAEVIYGAGKIL